MLRSVFMGSLGRGRLVCEIVIDATRTGCQEQAGIPLTANEDCTVPRRDTGQRGLSETNLPWSMSARDAPGRLSQDEMGSAKDGGGMCYLGATCRGLVVPVGEAEQRRRQEGRDMACMAF